MKKYILDLTVTENLRLHANYVLLKLTSPSPLPEMLPGQFAEIRVDGSPTTFLRRPISINYVDRQRNEVWFLIQLVGDGTKRLGEAKAGDIINVVLPLGKALRQALIGRRRCRYSSYVIFRRTARQERLQANIPAGCQK